MSKYARRVRIGGDYMYIPIVDGIAIRTLCSTDGDAADIAKAYERACDFLLLERLDDDKGDIPEDCRIFKARGKRSTCILIRCNGPGQDLEGEEFPNYNAALDAARQPAGPKL